MEINEKPISREEEKYIATSIVHTQLLGYDVSEEQWNEIETKICNHVDKVYDYMEEANVSYIEAMSKIAIRDNPEKGLKLAKFLKQVQEQMHE